MLLSSLCVISSVWWSGGVSSQVSVSERKKFYSSSASYASAFAFVMNNDEELTGFELRPPDLVFICETAHPVRNSKTDRQHVPKRQE